MISYFVIAGIVFASAASAGLMSQAGMDWYNTINIPDWTPDGKLLRMIWSIIFITITISATIFWTITNNKNKKKNRTLIAILFFANTILIALWVFIFFILHNILLAAVEVIILDISAAILIYYLWPISRLSASILFPYLIWILFSTYSALIVLALN